jgi:hypothetical protein
MTQTSYKVGEAAGPVLAGHCPGKNVEPSGELRAGNGSNDAKINSTADLRLSCESCDALSASMQCQLS